MSDISAVLDTNVLVSGLGWPKSVPGRIVEHALGLRFALVTSRALLDELARVLKYRKLAKVFPNSDQLVRLVEQLALVVEKTAALNVVTEDEADNRVLEAAQASKADFVVTGDAHLLKLRAFEGTRIVTPAEFVALIEGKQP